MVGTTSVAFLGMPCLTNHLLLTTLIGDTMPMLAAAEASQDVPSVAMNMVATSLASEEVQDSKVAILHGMYSHSKNCSNVWLF
jgi:hypothetical protein